MPCNCDHMEPKLHERESKRIMGLLKEAGLFDGEVPYYGIPAHVHQQTAQLCKFCESADMPTFSLEMQIWWRDHQEADIEKLAQEKLAFDRERRKQAALEKLTQEERRLLGIME